MTVPNEVDMALMLSRSLTLKGQNSIIRDHLMVVELSRLVPMSWAVEASSAL
jgi:hypothetical protein